MPSYSAVSRRRIEWSKITETTMTKLLVLAGIAALLIACAAPTATVGTDPMHGSRGSTEAGASKAAGMGFHGPLDRTKPALDGPN
jgi:hypothetical protein